jgi:phosphonate transport system ATP-binding protein
MTEAVLDNAAERISSEGSTVANTTVELQLSIRDLRKGYPGRGTVLDGINLDVSKGEAVSLIGSNGCGKSTLLRCSLRLIEPDQAQITFLGEDVHALGKHRLRKLRAKVGFVFQKHNLALRSSVLTNVVHGSFARIWGYQAWNQACAPKHIRDEAMHCLERVGLAHLSASRADRLSGGESQRVAIARAIMQKPKFLMADEPVASLDPRVADEVMELLLGLTRQEGLTLLYVSHNLDHALNYADRVVGLRDHKITLDAPAGNLSKPELRELYGTEENP